MILEVTVPVSQGAKVTQFTPVDGLNIGRAATRDLLPLTLPP